MYDPDPRPPLVPKPFLDAAKVLIGVIAVLLAVGGGLATFVVAAIDVWAAWAGLVSFTAEAGEKTIVQVVKSIDAILLGLVQFLLAAYLWQILDPNESLVNDENMVRLEEAKQILCKVVLVIVAVRMLGVVIETGDNQIRWEHMIMPAGIAALAYASMSLKAKPPKNVPTDPR